MLKTLTIWNFALLEHVQVHFGSGLNILTGETGAGKSILIGAIGAVLGKRITAESIRTGCDWLRVEAVFSLEDLSEDLFEILKEQAIDATDSTLVIRRQMSANGRGNILINGCHVTLSVLRQVGSHLLDIHGQNDSLALLKPENQMRLLMQFDDMAQDVLKTYQETYLSWKNFCKEYARRKKEAHDTEERQDMLSWQEKEIADAKLKIGEDVRLEKEIERLSHAERISHYVEESYRLFSNDTREENGIISALAIIKRNLEDLLQYDDALENARKLVEESYISLQEASDEIRDYGEGLRFDPNALDVLQERMDKIYRLRKKYGATIEEILSYQQKIKQELASMRNLDADLSDLKKQIALSYQQLKERASRLTEQRTHTASILEREIEKRLSSLGMSDAHFHISVIESETYTKDGHDFVKMLFSANAGQAEKPLNKIASGGELSRIALAIKTVASAKDDAVPSMVFDEIDTGIGGKTAQMVAECIAIVSQHKQVLCITHLPQIACMADNHLYIAKSTKEGSTNTTVNPLAEVARVKEIARMASGDNMTTASLENAKEMLAHAHAKKEELSAM